MKKVYPMILILSMLMVTLSSVLQYNVAQSSMARLEQVRREQNKNIMQTIENKQSEIGASLKDLYKNLETCQYSDCLSKQFEFEYKMINLLNYYEIANCQEHIKKITDINRYMSARFYIAKHLAIEKKKQLAQVQKDYYSVITEEFNSLRSTVCLN